MEEEHPVTHTHNVYAPLALCNNNNYAGHSTMWVNGTRECESALDAERVSEGASNRGREIETVCVCEVKTLCRP